MNDPRARPVRAGLGLAVGLVLSFTAPQLARAQGIGVPVAPDVGPAVEGIGLALFAPPLVVNAIHVAQGSRPPLFWPVLGIVLGGLGATLGLAYALPASSDDSSYGAKVGLGWALVGEGAVNIGLAAWALALPQPAAGAQVEPPARRWTVSPFFARDLGGRPRVGAVVDVVAF